MNSDLAERFGEAASWLDSAFARLEGADFLREWLIRDESNMNGFDWAVPNYRWSTVMTRDTNFEGEIWRTRVDVSYIEFGDVVNERTVTIGYRAEVFQRGSRSRFDQRAENVVPLDSARDNLFELVERACRDAEAALPEPGRSGASGPPAPGSSA